MLKNKTKLVTTMLAVAGMTLSLFALSGVASATAVDWNGVTFQTQGNGTTALDGNGDLLVTPGSTSFGLHVNRLPDGGNAPSPINANGTPFISFSYMDTGVAGQNIDLSIQDETVAGQPRIQAGSLFAASQVVSATYGDNDTERNANENYLFYTAPRAAASHTVVLGKAADGMLYASFDGEQRSSDIFKNAGISFDFNDVLLRVRGGSGSTFRFTGFSFGDNFSPVTQAVPEPSSLAMFGLGGLVLMLLGFFSRKRNQTPR